MLNKKNIVMSKTIVKKVIVLPEEVKKKIEGVKFGWVAQEQLEQLVKESTDMEDITCQRIDYYLKKTTHQSFLVDEHYRMIEVNYPKKGFPVLVFKKNESGEEVLHGFVFIPKDKIEEIAYFNDGGCSIEDMYESTVDGQQDQVLFNLMVQTL